jgi:hypothetical protein
MFATHYKFCSTHPTYKALREPTGRCAQCRAAWTRRRRLSRLLAEAADVTLDLFKTDRATVEVCWKGGVGRTQAIRVVSEAL